MWSGLGDSKFAAGTDWPARAGAWLVNHGLYGTVTADLQMAIGGTGVHSWRYGGANNLQIDDALAADSTMPTVIIANLGVNDPDPYIASNDWETDYGYVLDAVHAWRPSVTRFYVSYPWKAEWTWQTAAVHAAIDNVIATRPWLRAGDDEAVWLPSTGTSIHYSPEATVIKAQIVEGQLQ